MTRAFDVVVIGSGPGGYVCAIRAAQLGFKTACIEAHSKLGGTCLNVGCIPSKALLESTHHYHRAVHEFSEHGIEMDNLRFNLGQMLARKEAVVKTITGGVNFLLKKNKVERLLGWASIPESGKVSIVNGDAQEIVEAKHTVIATGSLPVELPFAKFDHQYVVDSSDALAFDKVPEHLLVVGAGVIGLELGSVWARLGAKVTVIEALDHALGDMDREISKTMLKIVNRQGIVVHLDSKLESVELQGDKVLAQISSPKGTKSLSGDKMLVAVGRRPATANMGLEKLGLAMDKGLVVVNSNYESSTPSLYAIGDCIKGPMLAHKASEEGLALAEILAGISGHVNYEAIPNIVYTWPEIATVGLSEEACDALGHRYRLGKFFFKGNGRARCAGDIDGLVKIIADASSDRLLGVHIIGPAASEIVAELVIGFEFGASAEDIARSVHGHPTLAEAIKEAALDVDGRAIHS